MKIKNLFLVSILVSTLIITLLGCGESGGNNNNILSSLIYGGADPKGDYIAIAIDAAASTLTYHNYTTIPATTRGPYHYSKVTDPARNHGFQNLYETEILPDYTNHYAIFVIVNGVAVIYQMFDNKGSTSDYSDDETDGTPGYAFYRKDEPNLNVYQGTAYNWVNFKMGTSEGDFEAGFAGIDTNTTGLFYGACYNNRAEVEGWSDYDHGIKDINESDAISTSAFTYVSTLFAHTASAGSTLTLMPTQNNDFILDFGPDNGAGFAIRQASSKDWQSTYNGTYFLLVYENDNSQNEQRINPMKLVLSNGTTTGQGSFQAFPIDETTPVATGQLQDLETFPGGPGDSLVAPQFQTVSGCSSAISTVVQNAYKCHGGFIANLGEGSVLFLMLDPNGQYLCFTMFEKTGSDSYNYRFGFGVKD